MNFFKDQNHRLLDSLNPHKSSCSNLNCQTTQASTSVSREIGHLIVNILHGRLTYLLPRDSSKSLFINHKWSGT